MKVIIIGCGRVGAELAKGFAKANHEVVVIDLNPDAFDRLGNNFTGKTLLGSGSDLEVLEEAGVRECDALAAVTNSNPVNIAAALIAKKHFGVPKVIARISDPHRVALYESIGIHVICPTAVAAAEAQRILG